MQEEYPRSKTDLKNVKMSSTVPPPRPYLIIANLVISVYNDLKYIKVKESGYE